MILVVGLRILQNIWRRDAPRSWWVWFRSAILRRYPLEFHPLLFSFPIARPMTSASPPRTVNSIFIYHTCKWQESDVSFPLSPFRPALFLPVSPPRNVVLLIASRRKWWDPVNKVCPEKKLRESRATSFRITSVYSAYVDCLVTFSAELYRCYISLIVTWIYFMIAQIQK